MRKTAMTLAFLVVVAAVALPGKGRGIPEAEGRLGLSEFGKRARLLCSDE